MTEAAAVVWSKSKWISKSAAAKYIHVTDARLQELIDARIIFASKSPTNTKGRNRTPVVYCSIDDLDAYMRANPYIPDDGIPTDVPPLDRDGGYVLPPASAGHESDPEHLREIGAIAYRAGQRARARAARKSGTGETEGR